MRAIAVQNIVVANAAAAIFPMATIIAALNFATYTAGYGAQGGGGATQVANLAQSHAIPHQFLPYENPFLGNGGKMSITPEMMAKQQQQPTAAADDAVRMKAAIAVERANREARIWKARKEVEFINRHTNGFWKADLYLPIAAMSERETGRLFKTKLLNAEEMEKLEKKDTIVEYEIKGNNQATTTMAEGRGGGRNRRAAQVEELPAEFDSATEWPECAPVINQIVDQGNCGSCWAMAAASVLTDRICIWRLQMWKNAIAIWRFAVNIFVIHNRCAIEWVPYANDIEYIWRVSRRVFADTFMDSQRHEMDEREKRKLKETWFKLFMEKWVTEERENVDKVIFGMGDKLRAFTEWFSAENDKCTKKYTINKECLGEAEMRNLWCRAIRRPWGAVGANMLKNVFTREFGVDYQQKLRAIRVDGAELEMDVLVKKIMATVSKGGTKQSTASATIDEGKFGEVKLACLLEEFMAGHWDKELFGLELPPKPDDPMLAKMGRIMAIWHDAMTRLPRSDGEEANDPPEWKKWRAEMLLAFKEEANTPKNTVSVFHMLTCALEDDGIEDKCDEGASAGAGLHHGRNSGIVSGTNMGPESGCKPYRDPFAAAANNQQGYFQPLLSWLPGLSSFLAAPDSLQKQLQCHANECSNREWPREEEKAAKLVDHVFFNGLKIYKEPDREKMHTKVVKYMMRQIMRDGPVEGGIVRSGSILHYKTGIYKRTKPIEEMDLHFDKYSALLAEKWGHAVRVVGWGQQTLPNGEVMKYWRVANSWGSKWGENGFLRIVRGENELGIENEFSYPWLID